MKMRPTATTTSPYAVQTPPPRTVLGPAVSARGVPTRVWHSRACVRLYRKGRKDRNKKNSNCFRAVRFRRRQKPANTGLYIGPVGVADTQRRRAESSSASGVSVCVFVCVDTKPFHWGRLCARRVATTINNCVTVLCCSVCV